MPGAEARKLTATVVIITRNRRENLRTAVASATRQTARPQVLVIDDASTDGSAEMIASEFPGTRMVHDDVARGYIVQRNRAAKMAEGDILFSIDDDAAFSSDTIVEQILQQFDQPCIGAVAIPFVNVNRSPEILQKSPDDPGRWVIAAYVGTAHAIRRDLFLRFAGYREFFFHQGEEGDLCARLLEGGYCTVLGRSEPVQHFESPSRDWTRMDLFGRRNDILFGWCNVPLLYLPMHLLGTIYSGIRRGLQVRRVGNMIRGIAMGLGGIIGYWGTRQPISMRSYRLIRRLRRAPIALEDVVDKFS